jgi:hypothetical protein
LRLITRHAINKYQRAEVHLHTFLTTGLDEGKRSASRHGYFILGERAPSAYRTEGRVGPRAGVDAMVNRKILRAAGNRSRVLSRPTHSLVTTSESDICLHGAESVSRI